MLMMTTTTMMLAASPALPTATTNSTRQAKEAATAAAAVAQQQEPRYDDGPPSDSSSPGSPRTAPAVRRQGSVRQNDPTRFYASLLAGAGSGALASVLCAPLDLVRVRMQVWGQVVRTNSNGSGSAAEPKQQHPKQAKTSGAVPVRQLLREIKELEGYRGFFKGLGATLFTVPVFWAIYFPCYDELKSYWLARFNGGGFAEDRISVNPSLIHMMSAVQAGAIADVVCNPMFVVRTRLQTEALHDLASRPATGGAGASSSTSPTSSMLRPPRTLTIAATVRNLYREGGIRGFWRGMTANLLGLAHVAIQFPLYEHLKLNLKGNKPHESAVDLLLASSASKIAASLVSYPHEVIRSRMMDSRRSRPATFTDTCRVIYRNEGFRGFYAGLPVSVLRVIPNTCVTFVTYELFLRWTKQQLQQQR
jgi:solute carrier family 25 (mitochondrial folate transporter), member 32